MNENNRVEFHDDKQFLSWIEFLTDTQINNKKELKICTYILDVKLWILIENMFCKLLLIMKKYMKG